jgi:hypothetical protein
VTYLLACNLVVQHIISCNWVLPVGNIFIIIIIKKFVSQSRTGLQIYEGHDDQLNRQGPMA